jgi:hypothetical protein
MIFRHRLAHVRWPEECTRHVNAKKTEAGLNARIAAKFTPLERLDANTRRSCTGRSDARSARAPDEFRGGQGGAPAVQSVPRPCARHRRLPRPPAAWPGPCRPASGGISQLGSRPIVYCDDAGCARKGAALSKKAKGTRDRCLFCALASVLLCGHGSLGGLALPRRLPAHIAHRTMTALCRRFRFRPTD